MLILTLAEKGGESKDLTFDKTEIRVGRVRDNDIVLPKGNVSKHHCRLLLQNGQLLVEDLGSTNGTSRATARLHSAALRAFAGRSRLAQHSPAPSRPAASAAPAARRPVRGR